MPTPNTSAPLPAFWVNASGGSMLSAADATMPVGFLALRVSVALASGPGLWGLSACWEIWLCCGPGAGTHPPLLGS
ncbi:unnamed protein product [Rangifer tarandus platyrhynchus]|uniref:Uncharacterized protein n=1 Tax=Rangifer tarandus platyrhynchus TaxID=3082113 RepID=A0AC59Y0J1_RANTA